MAAVSVPDTRGSRADFGDPGRLWQALRRWIREQRPRAIGSALMGAVLGYGLHYLMATRLGGDDAVLFCASLIGPVFGWIGYAHAAGPDRFWKAVRAVPQTIATMFHEGGRGAGAQFFVGAAAAASVTAVFAMVFNLGSPWIISRYTFPAFALGCVSLALSPLGPVLSQLFRRPFRRLIPEQRAPDANTDVLSTALLGSSVAWMVGFWSGSAATKLAFTAAFVVIAFALIAGKRASPGSTTRTLLYLTLAVLLAQGMYDLLAPSIALAQGIPGVNWSCMSFQTTSGGRAPGGLFCQVSLLGHAAGPVGGAAGGLIGRALGEIAGRRAPADPPEDPAAKAREKFVRDWNRLNELDANIAGDPELARRINELRERARATGRFDADELTRIGDDVDRLGGERRREIDEQHQRNTEEFRDRQKQRETEEEMQRRERERKMRERVDHGKRLVEQETDPERRRWLEDFLGRHTRPGEDGRMPDDAEIDRAIGAIRHQRQNELAREHDAATTDADDADAAGKTAEGIRDWANRVNRELARRVPGGQLVHGVQNFFTDGVRGYEEGGLKGALKRGAANVLDNYTAGASSAGLDTQVQGGGAVDFFRNWGQNRFGQYDPRTYIERATQARKNWTEGDFMGSLGDVVDAAQDGRDAREDAKRGRVAWKHRGDDAPTAHDGEKPRTPADIEDRPVVRPEAAEKNRKAVAAERGAGPRRAGDTDGPTEPPARPRVHADAEPPRADDDGPRLMPGKHPEAGGAQPEGRKRPPDPWETPEPSSEELRAGREALERAMKSRRKAEKDAAQAEAAAARMQESVLERREEEARAQKKAEDNPSDEKLEREHFEAFRKRQLEEANTRRALQDLEDKKAELAERQDKEGLARTQWIEDDPRRALRKAIEERTFLSGDHTGDKPIKGEVDRKAKELQDLERRREAGDASIDADAVQRKRQELDDLHQRRVAAAERERAAAERLRDHMEREAEDRARLGRTIRERFGMPDTEENSKGNLRIAGDQAGVEEQYKHLQRTTYDWENKPLPEKLKSLERGSEGYSLKDKSVSVPHEQTKVHEEVHRLTHPKWNESLKGCVLFEEGATCHFADKVLERNEQGGATRAPRQDLPREYAGAADVVKQLEAKIGAVAIEKAKMHGDVDGLFRTMGHQLGHLGPRAESAGKEHFTRIIELVQAQKFDEAKALIDKL